MQKRSLARPVAYVSIAATSLLLSMTGGLKGASFELLSQPITPALGGTELRLIVARQDCRDVGEHFIRLTPPAPTPLIPNTHSIVVLPLGEGKKLNRRYSSEAELTADVARRSVLPCGAEVDLLVFGHFSQNELRTTHINTWHVKKYDDTYYPPSQPILSPGYVKVYFNENIQRPGVQDLVASLFRDFTIFSADQIEKMGAFNISDSLPQPGFRIVHVAPGFEDHFIALLYKKDLVEFATRIIFLTASTDATALLNFDPFMAPKPASVENLSVTPFGLPDLIETVLDSEFPIPRNIEILRSSQTFVKFFVSGIRGHVVRREKYWESILGHVLLVSNQDAHELVLIIDGYYAGGIGIEPPARSAFRSMEAEFYVDLMQFTEAFLHKIKERMEGHR